MKKNPISCCWCVYGDDDRYDNDEVKRFKYSLKYISSSFVISLCYPSLFLLSYRVYFYATHEKIWKPLCIISKGIGQKLRAQRKIAKILRYPGVKIFTGGSKDVHNVDHRWHLTASMKRQNEPTYVCRNRKIENQNAKRNLTQPKLKKNRLPGELFMMIIAKWKVKKSQFYS